MKIYLDIDGTLIHESWQAFEAKPAYGLTNFLVALRPYDTYWLTSHCKDGNAVQAKALMKQYVQEEFHKDIDRIKPTAWSYLKTEALDWNSDFIWFDNHPLDSELQEMKKCSSNQLLIIVNLYSAPKQLQQITEDILILK